MLVRRTAIEPVTTAMGDGTTRRGVAGAAEFCAAHAWRILATKDQARFRSAKKLCGGTPLAEQAALTLSRVAIDPP
jgi:hypothetical protein